MSPSRRSVRAKIIEIVDDHEVVVFVENDSPQCEKVRKLFKLEDFDNVDIKFKNVDKSNASEAFREELYSLTNQPSTPHVWVNGRCLGGLTQTMRAWHTGDLSYYLEES